MNNLDYLDMLCHMDLESEKDYVQICATGNDLSPRFVFCERDRFVHIFMDTRADLHLISYVEALRLIEAALRMKEL